MPKILRIVNRFNIGGPTYNVAYLTKYLSQDFETLLVGGVPEASEEGSSRILEEMGIEPVIIGEMKRAIGIRDDYMAYRKLRYIIHKFKPDIVHTHASKAGALGRMAAKNEGVPLIFHTFHGHVFHSYFGKAQTYFYKTVEKKLASYTDRIIAISDKQKAELTEEHGICNPEKVEVIPLGFDLEKFWTENETKRADFRARYKVGEDEIAVGIIGRLVPVKNHDLFLKAAAEIVKSTDKKVRFFIIGDGESKDRLLQLSESLGLKTAYMPTDSVHQVTFTSWIKNVDWAMSGLDIIALTSFNEGTPVSLIEAQACSKPVVSTRVGGIQNIVLEGETALLSENNHLESFTQNLKKVIDDEYLRKVLSRKGREFVKDRFHYMRLVSDTEKLYRSMLESVPVVV
jgi:glycosyltransferase involved in cell wall biosynthesis